MSDDLRTSPDPERRRLIRSVFDPSSVEEVAEAVSAASEHERRIYVERLDRGWRWGLVHPGGPYPLLRITARFLRVSHYGLVVGARALGDTGLSLLCAEIDNPEVPLEWALLELDGPLTLEEAGDRIRRAVGR